MKSHLEYYEEFLRIMCPCRACQKATVEARPRCNCADCRGMRRIRDARIREGGSVFGTSNDA